MMRLDDSCEAGLLNSATQYASLETSVRVSEFDGTMSRRPKSRSRCYAMSACIALIAVAAIVSVSVTGGMSNGQNDTKSAEMRSQHASFAPAPSPELGSSPGAGWVSSPSAPPLGGFAEPVTSPLVSPQSPTPAIGSPPSLETPSMPAFAPGPSSSGYTEIRYETICNTTIDPTVCLNLFNNNPNSHKVDLQQWTMMSMEAAEQALNKSYILAVGLTDKNRGNVALQQCIDVFTEALDLMESSMYKVAGIDVHNPGSTATDVVESVTAAMTYHDTCQEGIDDAGTFPGSDQITGDRANHVDTLLSIALTFMDDLSTAYVDPNHHRRLLSIKSTAERIMLGRRGLLSTQSPQRLGRLFPGKWLL